MEGYVVIIIIVLLSICTYALKVGNSNVDIVSHALFSFYFGGDL